MTWNLQFFNEISVNFDTSLKVLQYNKVFGKLLSYSLHNPGHGRFNLTGYFKHRVFDVAFIWRHFGDFFNPFLNFYCWCSTQCNSQHFLWEIMILIHQFGQTTSLMLVSSNHFGPHPCKQIPYVFTGWDNVT